MDSRYEDISRRAYELFLVRSAEHGHDLNDWLEAERQLSGIDAAPRRRSVPFPDMHTVDGRPKKETLTTAAIS